MVDVFTPAKRSAIMQSVKSKGTAPERSLIRLLRRKGVRISAARHNLLGSPDLVALDANVCIFVHGCFWHGHRGCRRATLPHSNAKFWRRKIGANAARDRRVARVLRERGFGVVTIWACQLRSPNAVVNRVRRTIERRNTRLHARS